MNEEKIGEYMACVALALMIWATAHIVFENYALRKLHISYKENRSILKEKIQMEERIIFLLEKKIQRLEELKTR